MSYFQSKKVTVPFGEDTLTTKVDNFEDRYNMDNEALSFLADLMLEIDNLEPDEFIVINKVVW